MSLENSLVQVSFLGAMYQLCVPLSFSSGGVNKPLENDGAFTYGFNRKVDPCE